VLGLVLKAEEYSIMFDEGNPLNWRRVLVKQNSENQEVDKMSLTVKGGEPKAIDIEDGLHKGKIKLIEERQVDGKDYSYLDVYVQLEEKELELKVGYPLPKDGETMNDKQALGKLVQRFTGETIEKGKEYDLDKVLTGKAVQFITMQNEKGYTEISKDSLKPLKEEA
jgi:hypothetical protein